MKKNLPIGFYDSGIGGLTTLKSCAALCPNENFLYYADSAALPLGNKTQEEIFASVSLAIEKMLKEGIKGCVIACNTATSSAVFALRQKYNIFIIGTEPAVALAAKQLPKKNAKTLVLTTEATAKQQKYLSLLARFESGNFITLPQKDLAQKIENNIFDLSVLKGDLEEIFLPHPDCEAVVLGCTHYIYVKELIRKFFLAQQRECLRVNDLAGKEIELFDGNLGIAKRLKTVLLEQNLLHSEVCTHPELKQKNTAESSFTTLGGGKIDFLSSKGNIDFLKKVYASLK